MKTWDFLGGSMVKNSPSNSGNAGWIRDQGIPHATWQPRLCIQLEKPTGHSEDLAQPKKTFLTSNYLLKKWGLIRDWRPYVVITEAHRWMIRGGGGIYQLMSRKDKWMAGLTLICKVIRMLRRPNNIMKPKYFFCREDGLQKEASSGLSEIKGIDNQES